jgi:hypothetical protein
MKNYLAIEVRLNKEDANDFLVELRTKMENEKVIYEYLNDFHRQQAPIYVVIVTGINPNMYETLNSWRDQTDFKINVIERLLED